MNLAKPGPPRRIVAFAGPARLVAALSLSAVTLVGQEWFPEARHIDAGEISQVTVN